MFIGTQQLRGCGFNSVPVPLSVSVSSFLSFLFPAFLLSRSSAFVGIHQISICLSSSDNQCACAVDGDNPGRQVQFDLVNTERVTSTTEPRVLLLHTGWVA